MAHDGPPAIRTSVYMSHQQLSSLSACLADAFLASAISKLQDFAPLPPPPPPAPEVGLRPAPPKQKQRDKQDGQGCLQQLIAFACLIPVRSKTLQTGMVASEVDSNHTHEIPLSENVVAALAMQTWQAHLAQPTWLPPCAI